MELGHTCATQPTARWERVLEELGLGVEVSSGEAARVTSLPHELAGFCGEGAVASSPGPLSSQFVPLLPGKHLFIYATISILLHVCYRPGLGSGGTPMDETDKNPCSPAAYMSYRVK